MFKVHFLTWYLIRCSNFIDCFLVFSHNFFIQKVILHFNHSHQVLKPLNQVISLVDQDVNHQNEGQNMNSDEQNRFYPIDEFEVRIMEPEKSGGPWQTKATIPMQSSENALTVRMVTLLVMFFSSLLKTRC